MSPRLLLSTAATATLAVAACGQPQQRQAQPVQPAQPAQTQALATGLNPQSVDAATFQPADFQSQDRTPSVLRAQILLDRARFSPGVIDGKPGENVRQAIAAFEEANSLPIDGVLDEQVFARLTQLDARPALTTYTITADDVKGPFVTLGHDMNEQARLKTMGYESVQEMLAERFHMTEELLAELNPNVDFASAGTTITVAAAGDDKLAGQVGLIEVDKDERA
ncbi:MAG: peptidoglycan-binding domain-containing protein, partial [Caulobacteraceae bacterium]